MHIEATCDEDSRWDKKKLKRAGIQALSDRQQVCVLGRLQARTEDMCWGDARSGRRQAEDRVRVKGQTAIRIPLLDSHFR